MIRSNLMPRAWTNSGPDLLLEIGVGSRRRVDLEAALRAAIRDGRLLPGTRLPASRTLARDLDFARGTVVEAYSQLVAEGYLASRTGSGTTVVWASAADTAPAHIPPADEEPTVIHDSRPGAPDLSSFPRREWLRGLRRVLATAPTSVLDYGDPRGSEELRRSLASYLARVRGVRADPNCIFICAGYCQALDLLGRALTVRGTRQIAVEDPGLLWYRAVLQQSGLRMHVVTVDEDGLPVSALGDDDDAVVVTPAHQYPMGVVLAPARRSALIDWAAKRDAIIVEDDYDGEFRYDRVPVGALQGLDPTRVAYVGTASKTLAPALRLAWIVAPPTLVSLLMPMKALADRHTATLDQLVLNDMLVTGVFDRHVRRMRVQYRERRDRLIEGVTQAIPGVRVEGVAAGLHVVLRLPPYSPSEEQITAAASRRNIAVWGMGIFSQGDRELPPALVLGYARPRGNTFSAALQELIELLAEQIAS
jgi:GntR family transcriptional regulator / MocR family aminotransferase